MKDNAIVYNQTISEQCFGGGGMITNISIANDGKMLARVDTHNVYFWDPAVGKWRFELRAGINFDPVTQLGSIGGGSWEAVLAPSNSDVRYLAMQAGGKTLRTVNGGQSYQNTAVPSTATLNANATERQFGRQIAVDFQNPLHVMGCYPHGTYRSTDGFQTVTAMSLPASLGELRSSIACDPTGPVDANGFAQRWYCTVVDPTTGGLYRTDNAGVSWTKLPDAPIEPLQLGNMVINPANGEVFCAGRGNMGSANSNSQVRIWRPSQNAWLVPTNSPAVRTVAFDPLNPGRVYAMGSLDHRLWRSTDNGYTFSTWQPTNLIDAGKFRWVDYASDRFSFSTSHIRFSPQGNLYMTSGIGVYRATSIPETYASGNPSVTWLMDSVGIENCVMSALRVAPDGTVGASKMDRGSIVIPADEIGRLFPSAYGVNGNFQFSSGIDYAPEDSSYWVSANMDRNESAFDTGITRDRGKSWEDNREVKTLSGGRGFGDVAVLAKDVYLRVQMSNSTTNDPANFPRHRVYLKFKDNPLVAVPIGNGEGVWWGFANYFVKRILIRDDYTPGRVLLVSGNPPNLGVYEILVNLTTGAVTANQVKAGEIISDHMVPAYWGCEMQQLNSAHEWIFRSSTDRPGLWKTTDSWATHSRVQGTDNLDLGDRFGSIYASAVGAPENGSSFKTVLICGFRRQGSNGSVNDMTKFGYFKSTDNMATWTRVSQFPGGVWDIPKCLALYPRLSGGMLIGTAGQGLQLVHDEHKFIAT